MLGKTIQKIRKQTKQEVNPMKAHKRGFLLTFMAVALLFSVACDYASVTAPEPIEAQSTSIAFPADEINAGDDTLSKRGGKKSTSNDDGSGIRSGKKDDTRYGWAF